MRTIIEKEYRSFFDEKTGRYMRTGIIRDGADTGVDPFMGVFPELLDVGIMGHCQHGRSGLCEKAGVECYQNGRVSTADNMTLRDFRSIAEQCNGKTYQFALGGCGDPDQHEAFEDILKICRDNRIVPNFTTSGLGMAEDKAAICKEYCGAVAVSWYRSSYTSDAINMLISAGVKTNIHYVLNRDTIEEAVDRLTDDTGFPKGINAVVFLLHKPVGQGSREKMIDLHNDSLRRLLEVVDSPDIHKHLYKIGFDSCTVPALIEMKRIDPTSLDTCEGARWSAYISADMQMMPCSFAHEHPEWSVSLRDHTILEAWNSTEFDLFRDSLLHRCPECGQRHLCMGGCPIIPDIVLCERRHDGI